MSTPLLKFRQGATRVTPPDKFRYKFIQDGHECLSFAWEGLLSEVNDHYKRNGYEQPENWKELAGDQNCQRLSGDWCEYTNGDEYTGGPLGRFELGDILHGTEVLASFTLAGRNVVPQEVAEQRALACSRCWMNAPVPGCVACFGLLNIVAAVVGDHETKSDQSLKSCLICKCHNRAQIWIEAEHLSKGTTDEQLEQFRRVEHCWKGKAVDAYRQSSNSTVSEPL